MALAVFLLAGCAARRKAAEVPEKEKVEQVGVNRQRAGRRGERTFWYRRTGA